MIHMMFSQSSPAVNWLAQFRVGHRPLATELLDTMLLVSHDAFFDGMRDLVLERAEAHNGKIGLYAEREIRAYKGVPNRLFRERPTKGSLRAHGGGPRPIQPTRTYDPEVGSEGLVAWLITELCRQYRRKFASHPGPDEIRNGRIRAFFLLTDFIGSGRRASTYMSAAWRVASVKSWHSGSLLRSEVIAYSGTKAGVEKVRKRPFVQEAHLVMPCPTVFSEFDGERLEAIKALCIEYDPIKADLTSSLGYQGVGALVAFAPGCPNNVPRILNCAGKTWVPLFPKRVTAASRQHFKRRRSVEFDAAYLQAMGQQRLAESPMLSRMTENGRALILVLGALRRGPRVDEAIAARTGLSTVEVRSLVSLGYRVGWIDRRRHVTDSGINQLDHARMKLKAYGPLLPEPKEPYYPTSLRVPS